jgi:hypothetical protein
VPQAQLHFRAGAKILTDVHIPPRRLRAESLC